MNRTVLLFSTVAFLGGLTGCLAHERGADDDAGGLAVDAATAIDAAPLDTSLLGDDVGPPDAGRCMPALASAIRFEPPLPTPAPHMPIVWLGYDYDAVEDGARIHLDVCGAPSPCPVDLVVPNVGDVLRAIRGAPGIAGTLDTDGGAYAVVHLRDARRCAGCGGELVLLAGQLVSGLDPAITVSADRLACSTGCGELRATAATVGETTVVATRGAPIVGPLFVSIASDFHAPCVICDCAAADVPATGAVAWTTGIFTPAP